MDAKRKKPTEFACDITAFESTADDVRKTPKLGR